MIEFSPEEYAAVIAQDQSAFTEEVFLQVSPGSEYASNWHTECIIEHLKAVEAGDIKSLIINMPPRSMKSISVSIAWPAYLLGKDPSRQIIVGSYASAIGIELSRKTRMVMNSPIYKAAFPNTVLSKETEEWFTTTQMGHRFVATNGRGVTGFGGDYIIVDDPINPMESLSDTVRAKANDWITGTLFPRANDLNNVKKVLVMQRLHQDDPTGHLLDKGGWTLLSLPAEFKKKTIIEVNGKSWSKEAGEYMHPERINGETLKTMAREGMTPYQIAGQYMQSPTPPDGGDFKAHWLQYYDPASKNFSCEGMNIYILYDPANSKKKNSGHDPDYTAMMVIGLGSDNNYYLLDMVRDRFNPTERVQALIALHKKWNQKAGKPPRVICEQYGMMTDAFYINQAQKNINYRFSLVSVGGAMRKEDRIRRLVTPFEEGRVYIPKSLPYVDSNKEHIDLVESLVSEYETFPVGRHDDMLDAMSRIFEPEVSAVFPRLTQAVFKRGGEMGTIHEDRGDWRSW